MIKKSISTLPFFLAGDKTHLQEVIHPKNDQVNLGYSLARAYIKVGESSLPHSLAQSELYYILEGKGKLFIEGEEHNIQAGDVVLVPAHAKQYVQNTGTNKLEFLCIVSPPWTAEGEDIC